MLHSAVFNHIMQHHIAAKGMQKYVVVVVTANYWCSGAAGYHGL